MEDHKGSMQGKFDFQNMQGSIARESSDDIIKVKQEVREEETDEGAGMAIGINQLLKENINQIEKLSV